MKIKPGLKFLNFTLEFHHVFFSTVIIFAMQTIGKAASTPDFQEKKERREELRGISQITVSRAMLSLIPNNACSVSAPAGRLFDRHRVTYPPQKHMRLLQGVTPFHRQEIEAQREEAVFQVSQLIMEESGRRVIVSKQTLPPICVHCVLPVSRL